MILTINKKKETERKACVLFLNRATLAGFILGLAGASLDFSSGYLIITQSMTTTSNGMGMTVAEYNSTSALVWGIGISAIGIVLVITAFVSVSMFGRNKMSSIGGLMIGYGIVMLFIGASMYSGITSMMAGSLLSSLGMFVIGALMLFNGALMRRARKTM